jgi:hypothetical protein
MVVPFTYPALHRLLSFANCEVSRSGTMWDFPIRAETSGLLFVVSESGRRVSPYLPNERWK